MTSTWSAQAEARPDMQQASETLRVLSMTLEVAEGRGSNASALRLYERAVQSKQPSVFSEATRYERSTADSDSGAAYGIVPRLPRPSLPTLRGAIPSVNEAERANGSKRAAQALATKYAYEANDQAFLLDFDCSADYMDVLAAGQVDAGADSNSIPETCPYQDLVLDLPGALRAGFDQEQRTGKELPRSENTAESRVYQRRTIGRDNGYMEMETVIGANHKASVA